ncbi:MAG: 4-hydroxybenzoate octaprenyltransferase [Chlamydiales bacterium]|nr:4-hydroxybenzoate octaprenyltransferase [Chlamydiales bacterium]
MRLTTISKLVVLPNTLFGLPWLVINICLAFLDPLMPAKHLTFGLAFWIFLAFLSARVAGMSFNRLIDVAYDAKNPRTQDRGLVTGELTKQQVLGLAWGAIGVFFIACGAINKVCLLLAPVAVAILWGYSYLKRVTPWYHLIMALNHALLPIFVWAALTGGITVVAVYLALAVLMLISSNDIIYGIQDVEFDREHGLHSMATAIGPQTSVWLARAFQALFITLLVDVAALLGMPSTFYFGIAFVSVILICLNLQLDISDPRTINRYMFCNNTWTGFVLMAFTLMSVL